MPQWDEIFQAGMFAEQSFLVSEDHTAVHLGSGDLRVLATPWMIAFMERTGRDLLGTKLPDGFSSVGVHLDIRHLAPTPVGVTVTARAEILSVEGAKVQFQVTVRDAHELLGQGTHLRVIISEARFLERLRAKSSS